MFPRPVPSHPFHLYHTGSPLPCLFGSASPPFDLDLYATNKKATISLKGVEIMVTGFFTSQHI